MGSCSILSFDALTYTIISSRLSRNSQSDASKFQENLQEIFSQYYSHNNLCRAFKSTILLCVSHLFRVNDMFSETLLICQHEYCKYNKFKTDNMQNMYTSII